MFEYKVVPAPQRAVKVKGLKTTADRFAHVLAERINAEAAGGWEFVRTETLTCEERTGLGRSRSTTQTMMVFARALGQSRPDAGAALAAARSNGAQPRADLNTDFNPQAAHPAPERGEITAYDEAEQPADRGPEPAQDTRIGTRDDWHAEPDPAAVPAEDPPAPGSRPAIARDPAAPQRRQEPLFRSSGLVHGERPARSEPVIRPLRNPSHGEDD